MLELLFSPIPGIIALVVFALIVGLIYAKSVYKNAGADEALIITGGRPKRGGTSNEGVKVVHGSGVFLTPFFQKATRLSLKSRALEMSAIAQDSNGVTLTVDAVAIVKVGDSDESIRAAAQRFLGQEKNIDTFAQEVLSGSLRASIGATDVSTIIKKRDELGAQVLNVARESLANQGLDVDSFEIKGIDDDHNYIKDLGRAEQARVRLLAEVAETNASRESKEASVVAEQAVAEAENTLALRKAALQLDTDKAAAEAAAAKPLAEAKAQQAVVQEQEITARKQAELKKAELESSVNAIADAEAYRVRVTATAAAEAAITTANGDRDARRAAAEALQAEGNAQAEVIRARGAAEAEATKASADALAEQSEALLQLRMIEMLPQIAHELSAPMGNIDNLTVVSTDGASQLTKNVASGFSEVDSVLNATMGVGIKDLLSGLVGGTAAGKALAQAQAQPAKSAASPVVAPKAKAQAEAAAPDAWEEKPSATIPVSDIEAAAASVSGVIGEASNLVEGIKKLKR